MNILDGIDWASLPVAIALGLILLSSLYVLLKMMQTVQVMQQNALQAGTTAINKAIDAFKDTSTEQRSFYTSKLEDMRAGVRLLEDRVREVEDENEKLRDEAKNMREEMKNLREEGEAKDKKIEEMQEEISDLREDNVRLRKEVNEKPKRSSRSSGRAAADK